MCMLNMYCGLCHIFVAPSYNLTSPSSPNNLLFLALYCSEVVLYIVVDCKVALTNKIVAVLLAFFYHTRCILPRDPAMHIIKRTIIRRTL